MKKKNQSPNDLWFRCPQCREMKFSMIWKDDKGRTEINSACNCKSRRNGFPVEKFTIRSESLKKHLKLLTSLNIEWGFDTKLVWEERVYQMFAYVTTTRGFINGQFITYKIEESDLSGVDHGDEITVTVFYDNTPIGVLREFKYGERYFEDVDSAKRACQNHFKFIHLKTQTTPSFIEWCPQCEQEVELNTMLLPQPCHHCGEIFYPCALCNKDKVKCYNCKIDKYFDHVELRKENKK